MPEYWHLAMKNVFCAIWVNNDAREASWPQVSSQVATYILQVCVWCRGDACGTTRDHVAHLLYFFPTIPRLLRTKVNTSLRQNTPSNGFESSAFYEMDLNCRLGWRGLGWVCHAMLCHAIGLRLGFESCTKQRSLCKCFNVNHSY